MIIIDKKIKIYKTKIEFIIFSNLNYSILFQYIYI